MSGRRKFTKSDLRKLTEAGINFSVEGNGREIEIYALEDEYAHMGYEDGITYMMVNEEKTEEMLETARKIVNMRGARAGWGGWYMFKVDENYYDAAEAYRGDYCDVSSSHHW